MGKVMILSFSGPEEHIVDKILQVLSDYQILDHVHVLEEHTLTFPGLEIRLQEKAVYRDQVLVDLSRMEFQTLRLLAQHPGWVLTKEQIYEFIYGDMIPEDIDNIIYCLMHNLRKKLEKDPQHPEYIQTIRGIGYKLVIPEE